MQVMLDLHVGEWVFLPCNVALACGLRYFFLRHTFITTST